MRIAARLSALAIVELVWILGGTVFGEEKEPGVLHLATASSARQLVVRVDADCQSGTLPWLSWDTEGGDRAKNNLLRTAVSLKVRTKDQVVDLRGKGKRSGGQQVTFQMERSPGPIVWSVRTEDDGLTMQFSGDGGSDSEHLELVFPFESRMAATTLLPAEWEKDGRLRLPAVVSAPDFGQMLLECNPRDGVQGYLRGSRENGLVEFTLELPVPRTGQPVVLSMRPVRLPMPEGLKEKSLWRAARRG